MCENVKAMTDPNVLTTRERILEATVEALERSGPRKLSLSAVAATPRARRAHRSPGGAAATRVSGVPVEEGAARGLRPVRATEVRRGDRRRGRRARRRSPPRDRTS